MEKKYVIIWTIVGFILSLSECITYSILLYNISTLAGIIGTVIFTLFMIISISFFVVGMMTLVNNDKSIAIGVLIIIFVSVIGGVFYLCWNPNRKTTNTNTTQSKNDKVEAPYQNLKELKDLLDKGIIDQKTYDEKSKKYIDML